MQGLEIDLNVPKVLGAFGSLLVCIAGESSRGPVSIVRSTVQTDQKSENLSPKEFTTYSVSRATSILFGVQSKATGFDYFGGKTSPPFSRPRAPKRSHSIFQMDHRECQFKFLFSPSLGKAEVTCTSHSMISL